MVMLQERQAKIKILYVHHFSGMGGATMSLFYIIEKLDLEVFDVEVLFLGGEGDGVDYYRKHGIKVRLMSGIAIYPHADNSRLSFISRNPLRPFSLFLELRTSVAKIRAFFEDHRYDIVHLNTSLLLAVGKAAKISGCKVVWHIREPLFHGFFGLRRRIVRWWIMKYADQILAISRVEAARLGESGKVEVVYNFVDLNKFDKHKSGLSIRKEFQIAENDFVVCNLGGSVHSKGADIFVEAAALLAGKYDSIKFVLVGYSSTKIEMSGKQSLIDNVKKLIGHKRDLSHQVTNLIKTNKLEKQVILTGIRTDIPEILAASNVLAWTATVPHFSRPIVEANAMSKAVVASDFPSTREVLQDQTNGLLCKPKDPQDLANKIEFLYNNRDQVVRMGDSGFEIVKKKFNADINFRAIRDHYLRLVGERTMTNKNMESN